MDNYYLKYIKYKKKYFNLKNKKLGGAAIAATSNNEALSEQKAAEQLRIDIESEPISEKKDVCSKKLRSSELKNQISEEFIPYIKKWVSIENIVCRHGNNSPLDLKNDHGHRSFIDDSNWQRDKDNNIIDDCEKIVKYEDCLKKDGCKNYKSSRGNRCINKLRIKYFEGSELAQKITGKFGDVFKIYYTIPFNNTEIGITIYCHILVNNNDVYILFNCGKVFNAEELYKSKLIDYLDKLYKNILSYDFDKIVLCGHSMGCVLASRLGHLIYEKDINYFNDKCLIIGSAPFKWLLKSNRTFKNLSNVFIFIYSDTKRFDGILGENKNMESLKSTYEIDEGDNIVFNNNISFSIYLPTYNLNYVMGSDGMEQESLKKLSNYPNRFCNRRLFDYCHNWGTYYTMFTKIFNF